jgi:pimeloyl-ACP methyl ester carboxylesterase
MVEELGIKQIVAMAHSLGGVMTADYLGQELPHSDKIVGFIPLNSPFRWKFDELLIRLVIEISKNAEALNGLLEELGGEKSYSPLAFLGKRARKAAQVAAGLSPIVGMLYKLGTYIPWIKTALRTLRNPDDKKERITHRTIGKFLRKCLEPMPEKMVKHFLRVIRSETGEFFDDEGRKIADSFDRVKAKMLVVTGEKDGLANLDAHIAPDLDRFTSTEVETLEVAEADHFTTIAGAKSPRQVWFKIAEWLHRNGWYPEYDAAKLEDLYEDYINPKAKEARLQSAELHRWLFAADERC